MWACEIEDKYLSASVERREQICCVCDWYAFDWDMEENESSTYTAVVPIQASVKDHRAKLGD